MLSHQKENTESVGSIVLKHTATSSTSHYLLNEIFEEEEENETLTTISTWLMSITFVILLLHLFNRLIPQIFYFAKNPLLQAHTPVYISLQNFRL